ncbi:MAG: response regulator [Planctomycetota bacterium]|nr:response regulator [Planctomycetota bacterium]
MDINILVIDDNAEDVLAIKRHLISRFGESIRITTAGSMPEARPLLIPSPTCVILDLHMHEFTGIETISELRRTNGTVPIVAITGGDIEKLKFQVLLKGVIDLMSKDELKDSELLARHIVKVIDDKKGNNTDRLSDKVHELTQMIETNVILNVTTNTEAIRSNVKVIAEMQRSHEQVLILMHGYTDPATGQHVPGALDTLAAVHKLASDYDSKKNKIITWFMVAGIASLGMGGVIGGTFGDLVTRLFKK